MPAEEPDILDCNDIVTDRYDVISRIGIGGVAQVYKVIDLTTNAEVALKICKQAPDEARFAREVELMRGAKHPHVMPIFDNGVHKGLPYLVMPLAQECLKDVRFRVTSHEGIIDVLNVFIEVCEGVQAFHAQGIVHRDIKPHNILRVDATWMIADLGFAKDLTKINETLTRTGARLGTEVYMSPEQLSGDIKSVKERSDIFQLGLVLYQMFTGDIPMRLDPTDITEGGVRHIVVRCVKTKPENRYGRVADLLSDVRNLITTYSASTIDGPDSVSWLDSSSFPDTCRKEIRRPYLEVRASGRWKLVLSAVSEHWQRIFTGFDQMFILGAIPAGCNAGEGVNGLLSSLGTDDLSQFSQVEKDVIQWLSLRRVVFAAAVKYSTLARQEIDALLVLFLNYIAPSVRTTEFLRQHGWRGHVTRMRPFFSKMGIKPTELGGPPEAISTLGEYEREWLATLEATPAALPSWWIDTPAPARRPRRARTFGKKG